MVQKVSKEGVRNKLESGSMILMVGRAPDIRRKGATRGKDRFNLMET